MSALDDALAKAQAWTPLPPQTPKVDYKELLRQRCQAALEALLTEAVAKITALGIPPHVMFETGRNPAYVEGGSETLTGSRIVGLGWPLQVFFLADDGRAYSYRWTQWAGEPFDQSVRGIKPGRPHGFETNPLGTGFDYDREYGHLVYRLTDDADGSKSPSLTDRFKQQFPPGHGPAPKTYPLEDVLAAVIVELARGNA